MNDRIISFMRYHPVRTQRGLEILVGFLPWSLILLPFVGSFFFPVVVAYIVIVFNVYWLYRSVQTAINATVGYLNVRASENTNWLTKLSSDKRTVRQYKKILHVVIIPNVKEPLATLERNVVSLLNQTLSRRQIFVVLGMEERARDTDQEKADYIYKKYARKFAGMLVTWHQLVAGETIGKHSNNTFAARETKKLLIDEKKVDIKKIVVTTCDVDAVFHQQYFALLTYKFLTVRKPYNLFFQGPFLMYNNVNRLPFILRLRVLMAGAGHLATLQKLSGRFMNFSTYSTSLDLLDRVGYWDVDVIPEDWHINLKAYFALKGNVDIVPLSLPVYSDAPESTTHWRTYKNTYQAEKRWAWGVIDIPYVIKKFFQHPEIPFWNKLMKLALTMEWHITWSVSWFLITLGATIPTILNPTFARTTLGYNLSRTSSLLLTLSIIGLITMTIIGNLLNPHLKKKAYAFFHLPTMIQWPLLPVLGFIFGALPGLESQTRMMLGKYIEYRVTEKV